MTSIPEQLSAARTSSFETQLDYFRAVTSQAFDCAEQVISLNLSTSRASVERSSNAARQLFTATDPRDLLLLGSQTQEQFQSLVAYSRQLLNIAQEARVKITRIGTEPRDEPLPPPFGDAPAAEPAPAPEAASSPSPIAAAQPPQPAPAAPEATAEQAAKAGKQPVVVAAAPAEPEPQAPAKAKPLAKALGKTAPGHPSASPVPNAGQREITLPPVKPVKPVEAAPPPPASRAAAADSKRGDTAGTKGGRRK